MKPALLSLVGFAAVGATGCALRTTDATGRVTTVGLVWSTHPAPLPPVKEPTRRHFVFGPERLLSPPRWIELRAAGLIFERTPNDTGVTLGYKDSIWVFPVAGALTEAQSNGRGEPPSLHVSQP